MKGQWNAVNASPPQGLVAAISAYTGNQCDETGRCYIRLHWELTADEPRTLAAQIRAATDHELGHWSRSKVSKPAGMGEPSEAVADTRWVLVRRTADDKGDVKAR